MERYITANKDKRDRRIEGCIDGEKYGGLYCWIEGLKAEFLNAGAVQNFGWQTQNCKKGTLSF